MADQINLQHPSGIKISDEHVRELSRQRFEEKNGAAFRRDYQMARNDRRAQQKLEKKRHAYLSRYRREIHKELLRKALAEQRALKQKLAQKKSSMEVECIKLENKCLRQEVSELRGIVNELLCASNMSNEVLVNIAEKLSGSFYVPSRSVGPSTVEDGMCEVDSSHSHGTAKPVDDSQAQASLGSPERKARDKSLVDASRARNAPAA